MSEYINNDSDQYLRPDAFLQRTYNDEPESEEKFVKTVINAFDLARKMKIPIALGSDTVRAPAQKYGEFSLRELKSFVTYGMSPLEAIKSATSISSQVLGIDEKIGSIEKNKLADLLI